MKQVSGYSYRRYGSIYETRDICFVPAFKNVDYLSENNVYFFDEYKNSIDGINTKILNNDKSLDMYELSMYYMGLEGKTIPRYVNAKTGTKFYTIVSETWNYAFGDNVLTTATKLSNKFIKSLNMSGLPSYSPYFGETEEGYWQPSSILDIPPFLNNVRFSNSTRTGFINQYPSEILSTDCDLPWSPCALNSQYAYMYDIESKEWFKCSREEFGGILLTAIF